MPDFEDIPINATAKELEAVARMGTAPEDNKTYGRKNGEWIEVIGTKDVRKSGHDLDDQQDVVEGTIYQCVSDYITSHSNISNDTQFHKGYFYVFNGYSTQYYYTRIDVQPTSGGGGTSDYADLSNKPKINNVELSGNKSLSDLGINIPSKTSDLTNDSGYITNSQVDINSVKPYDYEQTYTIPNDIASGSTVQIEFANTLREFALEITTPETVISAMTGYFYLSTLITSGNMNSVGRFWEPALGQSHASKLCVSFTKGRDGIYRLDGYKYGLTSDTDYSAVITYNSFPRQNNGRLYFDNPQPIVGIWFNTGSSGDISQLAGMTIKVRGLKW